MAKALRDGAIGFRIRIRIGALEPKAPGRIIFENEFFDSEYLRRIEVWSGVVWVEKPLKVWDGAAWVEKPLNVWDGAAWG